MLCRQWQFGEYRGEDAGSAIKAKVQIETAKLNRYAASGEPARPYDDNTPLEVRVEREAVPFTMATRVQIGRHFSKLAEPHWPTVRQNYLDRYQLDAPAPGSEAEAQLMSDTKAHAYQTAVMGAVTAPGAIEHAIGQRTR